MSAFCSTCEGRAGQWTVVTSCGQGARQCGPVPPVCQVQVEWGQKIENHVGLFTTKLAGHRCFIQFSFSLVVLRFNFCFRLKFRVYVINVREAGSCDSQNRFIPLSVEIVGPAPMFFSPFSLKEMSTTSSGAFNQEVHQAPGSLPAAPAPRPRRHHTSRIFPVFGTNYIQNLTKLKIFL